MTQIVVSSMISSVFGTINMLVMLISLLIWVVKARSMGISLSTACALSAKVSFWGIAGSRGFHCLDYWGFYGSALWKIVDPSVGGLSLWGAFVGGLVALIIYGRGLEVGILRLADAAVIPVAVGYLIGRIGWAVAGAPPLAAATDYPWGVTLTVHTLTENLDLAIGQLIKVHPVVVYECLWATGVILALLFSIKVTSIPGMRFIQLISGLALGRFFIGFVRVDPIHLMYLDMGQLISLAVLALATFMTLKLRMANRNPIRSSLDDDRSIDSPRY